MKYLNNHDRERNSQDNNRQPDISFRGNIRLNRRSCYGVGFTLYFEGSTDVHSCDKWSFYIFRLSPRERTGIASAILEAKAPIITAVFVFDAQFGGGWPSAIADHFYTLTVLPSKALIE